MGLNVKVSSGDGEEGEMPPVAEINITPMVDVMLVLLIIFMVTAPLMLPQLPITLPRASLDEMGKPRDPLIISIDTANEYFINNGPLTQQVPFEQLGQAMRAISAKQADNLVYIRSDKGVEYGKVVELISLVGASGFYKVSLMAEAQQ
ncbi:biopolymer transporter ExbD [Nevskia sp.]|uniref:ExbD/TolR family protein n=1 Tax=Nevskia sp. TaxID=1929292 RepID=UPI0025CC9243|nr:biopolymer transporter ExbD [Nevskia sp.]